METILSVQSISKNYGKIRAVNGLSLEVHKGEVFGILGPNGSGKTTTLSILLDLVRSDSGSFKWFGQPPTNETRKKIGSVIESPNFFPYLNAIQNLEIVCMIKDQPTDGIDEALKTTGLYERRRSKFRTFSFGMKQRLAVASALLCNPEVLILDEPTNGLDPLGIAQIREIVMEVAARGITIILASHLLDEVQKICSHVAVLNKGDKLFAGKVSEVLAISDSFELACPDPEKLSKAIALHPLFSHADKNGNVLMVHFKGVIKPEEINSFLFGKGIVLSHLSERKRSLEQHFLELLQDNK